MLRPTAVDFPLPALSRRRLTGRRPGSTARRCARQACARAPVPGHLRAAVRGAVPSTIGTDRRPVHQRATVGLRRPATDD